MVHHLAYASLRYLDAVTRPYLPVALVFAKQVMIDGRRLTVLGVVLGQRGGSLIDAALTSAERLGDSAA